jgi:glycosyltransferase involved in cell wall biosynthesis
MGDETVTILIPDLNGGGAERVIVTLANEFVNKGIRVNLLLVKKTGPYISELDSRVRIISLGSKRNIYSIYPLICYLKLSRPTYLLSTLFITNFIAVLAVKIARVDTKIFLREAITVSVNDKSYGKLLSLLFRIMRNWSLNRANLVIAPSVGVAKDLQEYCKLTKEKIKVIYNPIDLVKCYQNSKENCKILDGLPSGKKIVLGMGRLLDQKDFSTLINAFAISNRLSDSILVILGEGKNRDSLYKQACDLNIQDDVFLPGFVHNPYPLIARSDVFVLSSRYEGMPNALIQAVCFKKQVVSTNCPSGPSEILNGGEFGYLVELQDVKGMADGICKGKNGELKTVPINVVHDIYNSSGVAKQYLDLIFN